MEQLKEMKDQIIAVVKDQMNNLEAVDTRELGEAVDIIKDFAEAMYYCSVTEAMNSYPEDVYGDKVRFRGSYRDRMYYSYPESHDSMDGKSAASRRMFMEMKSSSDKVEKQRCLEMYMNELSEDIAEMVTGLSAEEKAIVKNKIGQLAARIV